MPDREYLCNKRRAAKKLLYFSLEIGYKEHNSVTKKGAFLPSALIKIYRLSKCKELD
jgi:hypothetical protein